MKFWKKSLMAQLVSYFLVLSLITWGVGIFVAYWQARKALEGSIFDRLTAAATLKEDELNRWVEDQRQVMVSIAQLPEIQSQVQQLLRAERDGLQLEAIVNSVKFSPDGRTILSGGDDATARLWDAATGAELKRLVHDDWVWADFSPDGRWLATISRDNVIRVWDAAGETQIAELPHPTEVASGNFSPDGQWLAVGLADGRVWLWEVESGEQVAELANDMEWVWEVEFSPDSQRLVAAGTDYTGRVWDVNSGEEVGRIEHDGWVLSAGFSPDGTQLVTTSQDRTVQVWTVGSDPDTVMVLEHDGWVNNAQFSPDGQWIVSASDDATARVWEAASGREVHQLVHDAPVKGLAISPNSQWLATWGEDGSAQLWEISSGREMGELDLFDLDENNYVIALDFSPDSQQLVTGSWDGTVRVWDFNNGQETMRLEHDSLIYATLNRTLASFAASKPDLAAVFLLDEDGRVVLATDPAEIGQSYAEAGYFAEGLQVATVQNLYPDPETGRPAMTVAVPIPGGLGVLTADLNLARMDAILGERTGMGETGTTYLVTDSYRPVSGEAYGDEAHSLGIDAAAGGADSSGLYSNSSGKPVVGVYRWVEEREVALLAEMEQGEAFAPARRLAGTMFVVGVLFAGVLTVGVYLVAYRISRPILAISDAAAAVESEKFEASSLDVIRQREDELGLLARVFDHMAEEVFARERKLKQEVVELRIQIDEAKRSQEVSEIKQSDYYKELQDKIKAMRLAGAGQEGLADTSA